MSYPSRRCSRWVLGAVVVLAAGSTAAGQEWRWLAGHDEPVYAVAYSPDGKWLASASFDRTVRLWDRARGETARTLADHQQLLLGVAISPTGQHLASTGLDQRTLVYDFPPLEAAGGASLPAPPTALALTPDGQRLAVGTESGTVLVVGAQDLAVTAELAGLPGPIRRVSWRAGDGQEVWALNSAGQAASWRLGTAEPRAMLAPPEGTTLAIDESLRWLAIVAADGALEVQAWPPIAARTLVADAPHRRLALAPSGDWVATAAVDGRLRVWRTSDGFGQHTLVPELGGCTALAASASRVFVGTDRGNWQAWDVVAGTPVGSGLVGSSPVERLAPAPAGGLLATASGDGWVRLWNDPPATPQDLPLDAARVAVAAVSADRQRAAFVQGRRIEVRQTADGALLGQFDAGQDTVHALAFFPDGQRLASGGEDGRVRIHHLASGGTLAIEGLASAVRVLAVSPAGAFVAAGTAAGRVQVLNPADGSRQRELDAHPGPLAGLAWLPGGVLISAGDHALRWWQASDGAALRTVEFTRSIATLAASDDGQRLAVATREGVVTVVAAGDGTLAWQNPAHDGPVVSLAWSPHGQSLASLGEDRRLVRYRQTDGVVHEVRQLDQAPVRSWFVDQEAVTVVESTGHWRRHPPAVARMWRAAEGNLQQLEWFPDGTRVATLAAGGPVRLWSTASGQLEREMGAGLPAVRALAPVSGGRLATWHEGETALRLWQVADGAAAGELPLPAEASEVLPVAEGHLVLVRDRSGTWHRLPTNGRPGLAQPVSTTDLALDVRTSADGRLIAALAADGQVHLWPTNLEARAATGLAGIKDARWVLAGHQLLLVAADGSLPRWNLSDGQLLPPLAPAGPTPTVIAVDRLWRWVAVAREDRSLSVWNLIDGAPLATGTLDAVARDLVLAEDGEQLFVAQEAPRWQIVRWRSGRLVQDRPLAAAPTALATAADGRTVWVAQGSALERWPVASPAPRLTLAGHAGHCYAVAFNRDGTKLATAGSDNVVKLWNTADGVNFATTSGHSAPVYAVAFHPTADQVASCGMDRSLRLWNVADAAQARLWTAGIADGLFTLDFQGDGRLATGGLAQAWQLWDPGSDEPLTTVPGHASGIYRVAFNHRGDRLATLAYTGELALWDPSSTAAPLVRLQLPLTAAYSLAWSPDDRELAVAGLDARVLLVAVSPAAASPAPSEAAAATGGGS